MYNAIRSTPFGAWYDYDRDRRFRLLWNALAVEAVKSNVWQQLSYPSIVTFRFDRQQDLFLQVFHGFNVIEDASTKDLMIECLAALYDFLIDHGADANQDSLDFTNISSVTPENSPANSPTNRDGNEGPTAIRI